MSRQEKYGQHQLEALTSLQILKTVESLFYLHKKYIQIKWSLQVCRVCTENTHGVPEAVIFVDVSCAGGQFDAVT